MNLMIEKICHKNQLIVLFTSILLFSSFSCYAIKEPEVPSAKNIKQVKAATEVVVKDFDEWFVRLVVKDNTANLEDKSALLGQLRLDNTKIKKQSKNLKTLSEFELLKQHSLKSMPPFSGKYLYAIFIDPKGLSKGNYKTNFHLNAIEDNWRFTIKSSDPKAEIELSWDGLYGLERKSGSSNGQKYQSIYRPNDERLRKIAIIDELTGKEIPILMYGEKKTHSFNMGGVSQRLFSVHLYPKNIRMKPPMAVVYQLLLN